MIHQPSAGCECPVCVLRNASALPSGERCICPCNVLHPPAAHARCAAPAVTYRTLAGTAVGPVPMPLCMTCNARWHALGRGRPAHELR